MIANKPVSMLTLAKLEGCIDVLIDETMFDLISSAIGRSRIRASLMIATSINETKLTAIRTHQLNFDAHILTIAATLNSSFGGRFIQITF